MPTVELSAGPIEYDDTGGDGPVIVFTHGLIIAGSVWRKVVPGLAPRYRCITPTFPLGAHRRPMRADADLRLPAMVALVAEFLDALDLHDATVVANDWGGAGLLPAFGLDARVGRLVFVACEAFDNYPPGLVRGLAVALRVPGAAWLLAQGLRFRAVRRAPGSYGWASKRPVPAEVYDEWFTPIRRDPAIRRDMLRYGLSAPPAATLLEWYERLRDFDRPVLVVWATEDRLMPREHGGRLADLFGDARLVELDDTYTLISEDAPEALTRELSAFLAETARGEGATITP